VRMGFILPPCFLLQVKEQVASLHNLHGIKREVAQTSLFLYNNEIVE